MARGTFSVVYASSAAGDLERIASFIARDSAARALAALERIERCAESLSSQPWRGRVVPELARLGISEFRELVARPFRIVYRVEARLVRVYAVLDGRSNLREIFLARFARTTPT